MSAQGAAWHVAKCACLIAIAAVAACGNKMKGPPPIVDISARDCTARPVLDGAKPVPLDADKAVTVTFDGNSPCWQAADGRRVYGAFALPQGADPILVTVVSSPLGTGLLSPRALLLDQQQAIVREVARDGFRFHGASLYVGIRLHANERYLVVTSDPAMVGAHVSQIVESTSTSGASVVVPGGIAFYQIHMGADANLDFVYSHNGTVVVAAQPMPTAK